jgi:hypothetical protein
LRTSLRSVDWKRFGLRAGIAVGATMTLLFTALIAAELSDDLRPSRAHSPLTAAASPQLGAAAVPRALPLAAPLDDHAAQSFATTASPVRQVTPAIVGGADPEAVALGDIEDPESAATASAHVAAESKKKATALAQAPKKVFFPPVPKSKGKLALRTAPF